MYMKAFRIQIENGALPLHSERDYSVIFFQKIPWQRDYYLDKEKLAQRPHMKALGLGINLFFIWLLFVSMGGSSQN